MPNPSLPMRITQRKTLARVALGPLTRIANPGARVLHWVRVGAWPRQMGYTKL